MLQIAIPPSLPLVRDQILEKYEIYPDVENPPATLRAHASAKLTPSIRKLPSESMC
jgi:hypothetical protein